METAASRFPLRKPWDHAIDLKDSFRPKKGRLIPLSPEEQKEVSEFVNKQLAKGYIRPSKSEQTSPVFFVPKKDRRKRMVQDYRYLNEHTVQNNYPLPLISQLIDKLKGSQYFMKIDLQWELLQSFSLIVLSYFLLILAVYSLGEVDVTISILLIFSFVPCLPFVSSTFLWT